MNLNEDPPLIIIKKKRGWKKTEDIKCFKKNANEHEWFCNLVNILFYSQSQSRANKNCCTSGTAVLAPSSHKGISQLHFIGCLSVFLRDTVFNATRALVYDNNFVHVGWVRMVGNNEQTSARRMLIKIESGIMLGLIDICRWDASCPHSQVYIEVESKLLSQIQKWLVHLECKIPFLWSFKQLPN